MLPAISVWIHFTHYLTHSYPTWNQPYPCKDSRWSCLNSSKLNRGSLSDSSCECCPEIREIPNAKNRLKGGSCSIEDWSAFTRIPGSHCLLWLPQFLLVISVVFKYVYVWTTAAKPTVFFFLCISSKISTEIQTEGILFPLLKTNDNIDRNNWILKFHPLEEILETICQKDHPKESEMRKWFREMAIQPLLSYIYRQLHWILPLSLNYTSTMYCILHFLILDYHSCFSRLLISSI